MHHWHYASLNTYLIVQLLPHNIFKSTEPKRSLMIDSYDFGRIVIDGKEYNNDIIIIEGRVYPEWWREEGHFLSVKDLGPVLEAKINTLIIGTGHSGAMRIGRGVREYCKEKGIELIELKSREAVERYNEIIGSDLGQRRQSPGSKMAKGVAIGIHLTC